MAVTVKMQKLLAKVKDNAVIAHDADDTLLLGLIAAAIDYAEVYQKVRHGRKALPPSTEQAVIVLATHWYESRDGSTGGFFADTAAAGERVWETVHRLLAVNRHIEV
jgi:hypothetical protein